MSNTHQADQSLLIKTAAHGGIYGRLDMEGWISRWRQTKALKKWNNFIFGLVALLVVSGAISGYAWARKDIQIVVDGETKQVVSFAQSVGQLLADEGVTLNPHDQVEPAVDAALQDGMEIIITRAFQAWIEVDGQQLEVTTLPDTVGEILRKAGVELGAQDRVEPEREKFVDEETVIKVVRIRVEEVVEKEELPFQVVRQPDHELERGLVKTVQKGKIGICYNTYRITYEDGQMVEKELVSKKVVQEPVPEKIRVGTLQVVSRGGINYRFKEAKSMIATAYAPTGNRTYTGTWPKIGSIAVDPRVIPLGTRLYVEGYGPGKAEDIGSAIKGNRIDVFVESEEDAAKWGRRRVKVYLLE
ncbi:MAG: ubiquitin-like domain-containing protein [Bacillota bacterium]